VQRSVLFNHAAVLRCVERFVFCFERVGQHCVEVREEVLEFRAGALRWFKVVDGGDGDGDGEIMG
jgi:hypothetical protein